MASHSYNWKCMEFDPTNDNIFTAFIWCETPEGLDWWADRSRSRDAELQREAHERFELMKRLYAVEMVGELSSDELDHELLYVGPEGNSYGGLVLMRRDGIDYWCIENFTGMNWEVCPATIATAIRNVGKGR